MPDPQAVNSMFARIASRYDIANHLLSGGVDFSWRRTLVRAVRAASPSRVLDLATGSGDVAFSLAEALPSGVDITGMDFCEPMLDQARAKQSGRTSKNRITFTLGDGMAIPLPDQSMDAVTVAFGLRNMADRARALSEMRRVLRPDGRIFILEFSQPYSWFRPVYLSYLRWILPPVASVVTGDAAAYRYLGGSIESFPDRAAVTRELESVGFQRVQATALTLGIVALHQGDA